jgi:hypothetical protein
MKLLAWPRKHKWLSGIIVAIAAVIIALFVLIPADNRHDKQDFVQARSAIDTIYEDIVASIGRPDDYKNSDTCSSGYSGPYDLITDCEISTDFIYGVKDHQDAIGLSTKIERVIGIHSELLQTRPAPDSDLPNNPAPSNYSDSHITWYKTLDGLNCSYGYVFDRTNDRTKLELKESSKGLKRFSAGISCIGEAKEEYYPHT